MAHGNEDTFREMLRIQRSIAASFSHQQIQSVIDAGKLAAQIDAANTKAGAASDAAAAGKRGRGGDAMAALEAEAAETAADIDAQAKAAARGTALSGFVSAGVIQQGQQDEPQEKRQRVIGEGWIYTHMCSECVCLCQTLCLCPRLWQMVGCDSWLCVANVHCFSIGVMLGSALGLCIGGVGAVLSAAGVHALLLFSVKLWSICETYCV